MNGSVELTSPYSFVDSTPLLVGSTIWDHFHAIDVKNPVVCVLNGEPVLRRDWDLVVTEEDELQFVILPLGGTFRKIISAVAMIALMVAAPMIAGPLAVAMGFAYGGVVASMIGAAIVIGGSMLINALLGPGSPNTPDAQDTAASPTYTLSAQGNSARLLQPIPRLYGRHMIYPDFAAQPWSIYKGNDQYLYQLFCLGLGEYDHHQVRIEDTVLWDETDGYSPAFSDVELQFIPPGQAVTLFPTSVHTAVEVGGQDLVAMDDSISNVNFAGNRISLERVDENTGDSLVNIQVGDTLEVTNTVDNDGTYTVAGTSGDGEWVDVNEALVTETAASAHFRTISWMGPFAAVEADRRTRTIMIDMVMPRGLFYANDAGGLSQHTIDVLIQAREIDDAGAPLGDWSDLATETFTEETATPVRRTLEYDVAMGRYEVRIRRITHSELSTRFADDIQWGALRSLIPDDNTYDDVSLLAVKMRATNQLTQQSARRFNVIQTARLPVWDGTTWSDPQPTRSIAWAAADLLRNEVYGAGLPDSRIDLTGLLSLDQTWTARGDTFDGVFDSAQTMWDALSNVLRVGRTQPILIAGMVNFVRDEPSPLVRGVFTPRNIIRDSFETTYVMYDDNSPDAVIVEYLDERTWQQNEVVCRIPESTEDNPARIKLFGCVQRSQAWREGMYQAASNLYRRMFGTLTSEMEGRMLIRGDAVAVSYDIPKWGTSSEVIGWNAETLTLELTEPAFGDETVCALSDRRGRLWGPVDVASISEDGIFVTLDSTSLADVEADSGAIPVNLSSSQEETRVLLGSSDSYHRQFKIVTVRPEGQERARLGLTVDDARVYEADSGEPPAESDPGQVSSNPLTPVVTGVTLSQDPFSGEDPVTLNASWNPAPNADRYLAQTSTDGISWRTVYSGIESSCTFAHPAGSIYFRVIGIGALRGEPAYPDPNPVSYGAAPLTPSQPKGLTVESSVESGVILANWGTAARATHYVVRILSESDPGVFDVLEIQRVVYATSVMFTSTDITSAGGPWTNFRLTVEPVNSHGSGPEAQSDTTGVTIPAPATVYTVTRYDGEDINLQWTDVVYAQFYLVEIYHDAVKMGEFNTSTNSLLVNSSALVDMGGPWRSLEARVISQNGTLESAPATLAITDAAPAVPGNIVTSSPSPNVIDVSWDPVEDANLKAYVLFASDTSGFTPSLANEVYRGSLTQASFAGYGTGTTTYMVLRAEDDYAGGDGYNDSAEFSQVAS